MRIQPASPSHVRFGTLKFEMFRSRDNITGLKALKEKFPEGTVTIQEPPPTRGLTGASLGSVGANDTLLKDAITMHPVMASTMGILGSSPDTNSVKKPAFHEYESE